MPSSAPDRKPRPSRADSRGGRNGTDSDPMILLPLFSIVGYSLLMSVLLGVPIGLMPFWTASMLIAGLFITGLFSNLWLAQQLLLYGGLVALVNGLFLGHRRGNAPLARLGEPSIVVFLLFSMALWFKFRHATYVYWDEFSHWGTATKEMFWTRALPKADTALFYKDYPPGAALFDNFILNATGYSESNAYAARTILLLTPLAVFLHRFNWRRLPAIAVTSATAFALPFCFDTFVYQSMYVDQALSAAFGTSVAAYLLARRNRAAKVLLILPTIFILPLLKGAGLLLALGAASAIAVDLLSSRTRRTPLLLALLFLAPLASSRLWKKHMEQTASSATYSAKTPLTTVIQDIAHDPRKSLTVKNFAKALFLKPALAKNNHYFSPDARAEGHSVAALVALLICLTAGWTAAQQRAAQRQKIALISAVIVFFFLLYTLGLLYIYLCIFNETTGRAFASFERYFAVFLYAWCMILGGMVISRLHLLKRQKSFAQALAAVVALFFISCWPIFRYFARNQLHDQGAAQRLAMERLHPALQVIPNDPGQRVFVVWQANSGFEVYLSNYEMLPRRINRSCWTLARSNSPGACDPSPDEFQRMLSAYSYLVLGDVDDEFRRKYGRVFGGAANIQNANIFMVDKRGEAPPRLIRVPQTAIWTNS